MLNPKIKSAIIFISLMFITACNAKTETVVETKTAPPAPEMQAGGYSNITNAKLQELLG